MSDAPTRHPRPVDRRWIFFVLAPLLVLGSLVALVVMMNRPAPPSNRVERTEVDGWTIHKTYAPDGTPLSATMMRDDPDESWHGPLSESGKPHGHWQGAAIVSRDDGPAVRTAETWYWYGEEVSEGDFHQRENGRRE